MKFKLEVIVETEGPLISNAVEELIDWLAESRTSYYNYRMNLYKMDTPEANAEAERIYRQKINAINEAIKTIKPVSFSG